MAICRHRAVTVCRESQAYVAACIACGATVTAPSERDAEVGHLLALRSLAGPTSCWQAAPAPATRGSGRLWLREADAAAAA